MNFFYFPELFFLTLFLAEASYRLTITFCRVSGIRNAFSCNAFTDKNYIPVITGVFFIVFIILNHLMFRAFTFEWFDLGLINQALWNTAHGRILEITDATVIQNRNWPNYSMLSGHVEWIFLVIAPLVKFVRNPELLLLIKIAALTCPIL
ncbi:MAG TPA: DUF2079 domain-containing protein, partial [Chitinispirillaceae bacterium]|nr:DUF2079 domain-containing protein [Chitinispirillaceae bacterium]